MNYWQQFIQKWILMLILFHFGFSMERQPRKSILNPEAPPFIPRPPSPEFHQPHQHQSILNPFEFQPPSSVAKYHALPYIFSNFHASPPHSDTQIPRDDLDENEALALLPDFMGDEYGTKKDVIHSNVEQKETDFILREREEAVPKLEEVEKRVPIEIDTANQGINSPQLKFGNFPPEILLTSKHQKDESRHKIQRKTKEDRIDEKHHGHAEKSSLNKVDILGHEISRGIEGERREKSELVLGEKQPETMHSTSKQKLGEDNNKKSVAMSKTGSKQPEKERIAKHHANEVKDKKEMFESGGKDTTSSTKFEDDCKKKLGIGTESKSPPTFKYYKRREKQQHLKQPAEQQKQLNIGGKSSSSPSSHLVIILPSHSTHHKQQSPKVEKKPALGISPSGKMKEKPEGASKAIKLKDTGEYDFKERNRYDPLKSDEHHKQLLATDEEEEITEKIIEEHDKYLELELEGTNQQGSRPSAKSKGKSVINTKEEKKLQKEKEKEEDKIIRELIENAAKERWDKEQLEKMRKDNLDKMIANKMEKVEKMVTDSLRNTGLLASSSTNVSHGHGDANASGSSASGGGGINVTSPSHIPNPSTSAAVSPNNSVGFEFMIKVEAYEKFKQIKEILKRLKEMLNELKKLENNWLNEKIAQFRPDIEKSNLNEKEKEIIELINNLVKQKEFLKNDEKPIDDLKKDAEKLKEEISKSKTSKNKKKKEVKKFENKLEIAEKNILKMENTKKENKKKIDKLEILLMNEFIEMKEKMETVKINSIEEKMKEPLKYLWTAYELMLTILNQYFKKPYVKNRYGYKRPFNYINSFYVMTISEMADGTTNDIVEFSGTMQLTLEKMLMYHKFYSTFNRMAYEKLKCFDVLSERINSLAEERKRNEIKNPTEQIETFGKYFKQQLNEPLREVFHFNMVGIDELPEVWDHMVLEGIDRLSHWLQKDRQRQFNDIWLELYGYFEEEKYNLKWLSRDDEFNDRLAENIFDLFPHKKFIEERLIKQNTKINDLYDRIDSSKFSIDVKDFILDAFDNITDWIRNTNILLKIEKRMQYPLLYLKSVYDKYWYMIYSERFGVNFIRVRQYHFYREKNQTEKAKKLIEEVHKMKLDIWEDVKTNFDQIETSEPNILDEMMEIIDEIDAVILEHGIWERRKIYEDDKDFMNSISEKRSNKHEYRNRLGI